MVNVKLDRQEVDAVFDALIVSHFITPNHHIRSSLISLILDSGMRKSEEDAKNMVSQYISEIKQLITDSSKIKARAKTDQIAAAVEQLHRSQP